MTEKQIYSRINAEFEKHKKHDWMLILSKKLFIEFNKQKWTYCPFCGNKLTLKVSTDINSGKECKNILCK
jgi:hypothetical protein